MDTALSIIDLFTRSIAAVYFTAEVEGHKRAILVYSGRQRPD